MASITAANAVFMLSVGTLFPFVQLQGFAADDVFESEEVSPTEVLMGVDRHLSGGAVPVAKPQTINLQADSASNLVFEQWYLAQQQLNDVLIANGVVTLISVGRVYTMTRGFLTRYPPSPAARRILQPRRYQITWESISGAPV